MLYNQKGKIEKKRHDTTTNKQTARRGFFVSCGCSASKLWSRMFLVGVTDRETESPGQVDKKVFVVIHVSRCPPVCGHQFSGWLVGHTPLPLHLYLFPTDHNMQFQLMPKLLCHPVICCYWFYWSKNKNGYIE